MSKARITMSVKKGISVACKKQEHFSVSTSALFAIRTILIICYSDRACGLYVRSVLVKYCTDVFSTDRAWSVLVKYWTNFFSTDRARRGP